MFRVCVCFCMKNYYDQDVFFRPVFTAPHPLFSSCQFSRSELSAKENAENRRQIEVKTN